MGMPRGPDSPSRSPLPMDDMDMERTRRLLDANSIDEDQVPTRGHTFRSIHAIHSVFFMPTTLNINSI